MAKDHVALQAVATSWRATVILIGLATRPTGGVHRQQCTWWILALSLQLRGARRWFLCPVQRQNFMHWCLLWLMVSTYVVAWSFYVARTWSTTLWWTTGRPSRLPTRKELRKFVICQGRSCGSRGTLQAEKSRWFRFLQTWTFLTLERSYCLWLERRLCSIYCIGMVDEDGAVGEAEYEEMAKKHEAGKRIKATARTLGRILAVSSLEGAYGIEFEKEDRCYEIETNEVTENDFVGGASWSMSWSLACMVLAISAVMLFGFMAWKAWKKLKQEVAELEERTQAAEEMARGSSVLSQSLLRRMNDAEWRMDTLGSSRDGRRIHKQNSGWTSYRREEVGAGDWGGRRTSIVWTTWLEEVLRGEHLLRVAAQTGMIHREQRVVFGQMRQERMRSKKKKIVKKWGLGSHKQRKSQCLTMWKKKWELKILMCMTWRVTQGVLQLYFDTRKLYWRWPTAKASSKMLTG